MKTDMHQNSLFANNSIEDKKPGARKQVLGVIRAHGPITRQQIADRLGWEINRVTGRVRELLEASEIEEQGAIKVDNRPRALLTIKTESTRKHCKTCGNMLVKAYGYKCWRCEDAKPVTWAEIEQEKDNV